MGSGYHPVSFDLNITAASLFLLCVFIQLIERSRDFWIVLVCL